MGQPPMPQLAARPRHVGVARALIVHPPLTLIATATPNLRCIPDPRATRLTRRRNLRHPPQGRYRARAFLWSLLAHLAPAPLLTRRAPSPPTTLPSTDVTADSSHSGTTRPSLREPDDEEGHPRARSTGAVRVPERHEIATSQPVPSSLALGVVTHPPARQSVYRRQAALRTPLARAANGMPAVPPARARASSPTSPLATFCLRQNTSPRQTAPRVGATLHGQNPVSTAGSAAPLASRAARLRTAFTGMDVVTHLPTRRDRPRQNMHAAPDYTLPCTAGADAPLAVPVHYDRLRQCLAGRQLYAPSLVRSLSAALVRSHILPRRVRTTRFSQSSARSRRDDEMHPASAERSRVLGCTSAASPLKKLAGSLTALSCRALREQRSVALDPPPACPPRPFAATTLFTAVSVPARKPSRSTVTKRYLHLVCTYLAQRSAQSDYAYEPSLRSLRRIAHRAPRTASPSRGDRKSPSPPRP
ncbi:hypothetical protein C8J57DRAFT_1705292 [Mycena rebaudengoi]|nr:hypothetical protein C8J57DRAFT_1705292 [Mycena rebaudengoi]